MKWNTVTIDRNNASEYRHEIYGESNFWLYIYGLINYFSTIQSDGIEWHGESLLSLFSRYEIKPKAQRCAELFSSFFGSPSYSRCLWLRENAFLPPPIPRRMEVCTFHGKRAQSFPYDGVHVGMSEANVECDFASFMIPWQWHTHTWNSHVQRMWVISVDICLWG